MNVIVWSVFVYGRFQHENTLKCPLSVVLFVKKLIKMTITTLPFLCVRRKFPYFFFFILWLESHYTTSTFRKSIICLTPKTNLHCIVMNIQKHCINVRDGFINLHLLDKKTKTYKNEHEKKNVASWHLTQKNKFLLNLRILLH